MTILSDLHKINCKADLVEKNKTTNKKYYKKQ